MSDIREAFEQAFPPPDYVTWHPESGRYQCVGSSLFYGKTAEYNAAFDGWRAALQWQAEQEPVGPQENDQ